MVKEKTEREKQIEAVRMQVEKAESKGQYDTAHHAVLKQLLSGESKPKEKESIEAKNG